MLRFILAVMITIITAGSAFANTPSYTLSINGFTLPATYTLDGHTSRSQYEDLGARGAAIFRTTMVQGDASDITVTVTQGGVQKSYQGNRYMLMNLNRGPTTIYIEVEGNGHVISHEISLYGTGPAPQPIPPAQPLPDPTPDPEPTPEPVVLPVIDTYIEGQLNHQAYLGMDHLRYMSSAAVRRTKDRIITGSSDSISLTGDETNLKGHYSSHGITTDIRITDKDGMAKSERLSLTGQYDYHLNPSSSFGLLLSGDISRTEVIGKLKGDHDSWGLALGGYLVANLASDMYLQTHISASGSRSKLSLNGDDVRASSQYTTYAIDSGLGLSGVLNLTRLQIRPSIALNRSYAKGRNVDVLIDGSAMKGLRISSVNETQLAVKPEFHLPLGMTARHAGEVPTFKITPSYVCSDIKIQGASDRSCGGGYAVALYKTTDQSRYNVSFGTDRLRGVKNRSARLDYTIRF